MAVLLYKGSIPVTEQNLTLYSGMLPVELPPVTGELKLTWKGARLDPLLWAQVIEFFRWTNREHKTEAQVRLFYSEQDYAWRVEVFPQRITGGLHTPELTDHPLKKEVWDTIDINRWKEAGTIHHHCDVSAFQSGGDFNDEKTKNGLHITVGHVSSDPVELHARATFRGVQYAVELGEWLGSTAEWWVSPGPVEFPERWKQMLIPPPPVPERAVLPRYPYSGVCGDGDDMGDLEWGRAFTPSSATVPSLDDEAVLEKFHGVLAKVPNLFQLLEQDPDSIDEILDLLHSWLDFRESIAALLSKQGFAGNDEKSVVADLENEDIAARITHSHLYEVSRVNEAFLYTNGYD